MALPALVALILAMQGAGSAWAAAGDLDPAFGPVTSEPGQWRDSFPTDQCPGLDHAQGIAVQAADGKIVVAGYGARDLTQPCADPPFNEFVVARLNVNGTLDSTFGDAASVGRTGWTTIPTINGFGDRANAVAIQPDGKVVLAGQAGVTGFDSYFGVARFNADGTLDSGFGATCSGGETAGTTTTNFAGTNDQATAVAIEPDGKIVAAGSTLISSGNYDFAVARYDADGCPDTTFGPGHDGKVTQGFPANGNDKAHGLVLQGDKIVVAGSAAGSPSNEFGLARFNGDGSLDPSFGANGETLTDFGGGGASTSANALVAQSDGRLVAAGTTYMGPATSIDFALARYTADGVLDSSFGTAGKVTTNFSAPSTSPSQSTDFAQGLALEPDGTIVAGGTACCDSAGQYDFALARYSPDGAPDTSFGANGQLVKDVQGGHDEITAVATQPDGRILTGGWDTIINGTENEFVVDRYGGGGPGGIVTPPGGGPGAPLPDTTAPVFLTATLTNRTFAVDRKGIPEVAVTAAAKRGTTFVYRLSEASRVLVRIERLQPGRKVKGRCVKPGRKTRHKKACTRYVKFGLFAQAGTTGANAKRFSGRIGKRSLKPGRYRATLVAGDPSGNRSQPKRLAFRVVRR